MKKTDISSNNYYSEKPDQQKKFLRYTISHIRERLNQIFEDSGNFLIEFTDALDEPFSVDVADQNDYNVSQNYFVVENNSLKKKSAKNTQKKVSNYKLKIKIGRKFESIRDIPKLIASIQETYEDKNLNDLDYLFRIDTKQQQRDYWIFMSRRLSEYFSKINHNLFQNPQIQNVLTQLVTSLENIGNSFDKKKVNFNSTLVEVPAYFEFEWEELKPKLDAILNRILQKTNNKSTKLDLFVLKRIVERLVNSFGKKEIIEHLNLQALHSIMHVFEQEFFKKADLSRIGELLPPNENYADITLMRYPKLSQRYVDFLQNQFPSQSQELEKLKQNLKEAKNKKIGKEEISKIQMQLLGKIEALVYSEKIFAYKDGKNDIKSVLEGNFANCMMIAKIIHILWYYYTGEESLAAISKSHFFEVVRLANGDLISCEDRKILDKNTVYAIGNHDNLYLAALLRWKAERENDRRKSEWLLRFAIKICKKHPDYTNQLAILIQKDPSRQQEAESLFRRAIELNSNGALYKFNLAYLLEMDPKRYPEAERLYMQAIALDPNNKRYQDSLANLLSKYTLKQKFNRYLGNW